MTETNSKPDMRNPEMSDARKAAEKKIGEAPFAPEAEPVGATSQSAGSQSSTQGQTIKQ